MNNFNGKRRLINALQNVAMVVLSLSALYLLISLPIFQGAVARRFQTFLTTPVSDSGEDAVGLDGEFASVGLMVTGSNGHDRYGLRCAATNDPVLKEILPLFQEALGSAGEIGLAADLTLQTALESPGIFLDLASQLPLKAVSVWLGGEETVFDRQVSSMALTTEEPGSAMLYLCSGEGEIFRYATALPVSAVETLCENAAPNGSAFAYETNYAALDPYAILAPEPDGLKNITGSLPGGYSTYNILTALDFNAHTSYRYPESGGAEVVIDTPRTLRISPDGTVSYTGAGEVDSELYRAAKPGDVPTMDGALRAACRLANALTTGSVASPLYLYAVDATEDGWQIFFRYQWEGIPIHFPDGPDALSVTVSGGEVTSFTYRSRLYEEAGPAEKLLPVSMAVSIASLYPGGGLNVGYIDAGGDSLAPQWLG